MQLCYNLYRLHFLFYSLTLIKVITDWQTKLTFLSDALVSWIDVQRNWMYLEGIFNAADIQRQLPTEAKLFHQVDKNYTSMCHC